MSSNTDQLIFTLSINKGDLNDDELDQITHDLEVRLQDLNVESIDFIYEQTPRQGTKTIDPVTVGALSVVAAQALLPKIFDLLQAWVMRHHGQTITVKVQNGDKSIELEFSETTDPDKIKTYVEIVNAQIEKKKRH